VGRAARAKTTFQNNFMYKGVPYTGECMRGVPLYNPLITHPGPGRTKVGILVMYICIEVILISNMPAYAHLFAPAAG